MDTRPPAPPPPIPPPATPIVPDATQLARQRKRVQALKVGRDKLVVPPSPYSTTGINVPQ